MSKPRLKAVADPADGFRDELRRAIARHAEGAAALAKADEAVAEAELKVRLADSDNADDIREAADEAARALLRTGKPSNAVAKARQRRQMAKDEAEVARAALPKLRERRGQARGDASTWKRDEAIRAVLKNHPAVAEAVATHRKVKVESERLWPILDALDGAGLIPKDWRVTISDGSNERAAAKARLADIKAMLAADADADIDGALAALLGGGA